MGTQKYGGMDGVERGKEGVGGFCDAGFGRGVGIEGCGGGD